MVGVWPAHAPRPALTTQQQVGSTPHYTTLPPPRARARAPPHSPAAPRQEAVLEWRRSAPANQKSPAGLQASNRIGHQALRPASEARLSDRECREIFPKRTHWWKDAPEGYAPCLFGSLIGVLEKKAANDGSFPNVHWSALRGPRPGGRQRARSNWRLAALPWGCGLAGV